MVERMSLARVDVFVCIAKKLQLLILDTEIKDRRLKIKFLCWRKFNNVNYVKETDVYCFLDEHYRVSALLFL